MKGVRHYPGFLTMAVACLVILYAPLIVVTVYSFNDSTAVSTDAGVGFPGTTAAAQKAGRTWLYSGCGVLSTAPATFSGSSADLAECATSNSASAYSIRYREVDLLGNLATSAASSVSCITVLSVISSTRLRGAIA